MPKPGEWRAALEMAVGVRLILIGELGHLGLIHISPQAANVKYFSRSPVLAKPCFTQPALHDGRLYLRNEKQLVRFDLRKPS
jgi:outer membrane protein assembly factor BamB